MVSFILDQFLLSIVKVKQRRMGLFHKYSVDLEEFGNFSVSQNSLWISFVPSRELMT